MSFTSIKKKEGWVGGSVKKGWGLRTALVKNTGCCKEVLND